MCQKQMVLARRRIAMGLQPTQVLVLYRQSVPRDPEGNRAVEPGNRPDCYMA